MVKMMCGMLTALVTGAVWAAPQVTKVNVTPVGEAGNVQVSYTVSEDAVVTFDVLVDSQPLADMAGFASVTGSVFRLVRAGDAAFVWCPTKALEDRRTYGQKLEVRIKAWPTNSPPDYMICDLSQGKAGFAVEYYERLGQIPGGITNDMYKTTKLPLRRIPAAGVQWREGTSSGGRYVTLSDDYYIGVYLLTSAQHNRLVKSASPGLGKSAYRKNYGTFRDEGWPGSGHELTKSDTNLYKYRDFSGLKFDMPTEAQWEFAARGGCPNLVYDATDPTTGTDTVYDDSGNKTSASVGAVGWYYYNYGNTHADSTKNGYNQVYPEVGLLPPNAYGLYDVLGLVMEWCLDWEESWTAGSTVSNPTGPTTGTKRRLRGGSCYQSAKAATLAERTSNFPSYGLDSGSLAQFSDNMCADDFGIRLCLPCNAVK